MKTELHVQQWPVEKLIPYARNARTHSEEQVAQVAASIVEFGWTNPILVGADGVIIAGHARLAAARKLKLTEVPVIVLDHLTPTQRRALVLADNRLALSAGWDEEMLRVELESLEEDGFDLDLVGFTDEEVEELLRDPEESNVGLTDDDAIPEEEEHAITVLGDVWVKHRSGRSFMTGGSRTRLGPSRLAGCSLRLARMSRRTASRLASCSYMLHPVIAVLRQWGIPFHNPYRKSAGFWNPLRRGRKGSSTNRILSLLGDHPWTHSDLKLWAEWLSPKGNLRTGAKELIDASDDSLPVTTERLNELFESAAFEALLAASSDPRQLLQWWARRVAPEFHARVQFPITTALASGPAALEESPHVIVGTIHSVKGGEADVVFLFPDVSPAGDAAYQKSGPQRDSVIRLFYVGMTRARHTLYVCQRESPMAVTI